MELDLERKRKLKLMKEKDLLKVLLFTLIIKNLLAFECKGIMKSEGSIWVNKRKYKVVRYFSDIDAIYLKGVLYYNSNF